MVYARAFAPATVANLGVGFDILGLAVDGAGDTVRVEWCDLPESVIVDIEGDGGLLPRESSKNVATIAADALLRAVGESRCVSVHLQKGLPAGSGLGSSAASAVAAAVAVNALLGEPFSREELLPFALAGEAAVSGYHADNIAPCLLGGITLTNGTEIEKIRRLPVPDDFYVALVTPNVIVRTADARAALPYHVSLKTMVSQMGAVAELIDGIYRGDMKAVAWAMESDTVVEPARAHLMPLLEEIRFSAKRAGALALVISGAGPTLCAVCDAADTAARVADAMQAVYDAASIDSVTRHGGVLREGAVVL